jgi:hypothetical protein
LGQDLLKEYWDELEIIPWIQIHGYQSSRGCPKIKANIFTFLKKGDSIKE